MSNQYTSKLLLLEQIERFHRHRQQYNPAWLTKKALGGKLKKLKDGEKEEDVLDSNPQLADLRELAQICVSSNCFFLVSSPAPADEILTHVIDIHPPSIYVRRGGRDLILT